MIKKYAKKGFGQWEPNQVAFRRDGRIEAQCKLGSDFSEDVPAENGMLLAVDNVTRTVGFPKNGDLPIALNYSTEHMYDERHNALSDFKLVPGTFLPRLGYLAVGDKWTSNTICYDSTDYNDDEALVAALKAIGSTPVYGGACTENGYVKLSKAKPEFGPVLKVVKMTTMPDGQLGVKLQVIG